MFSIYWSYIQCNIFFLHSNYEQVIFFLQCIQLMLITYDTKEQQIWNITYITMAFKEIWWASGEDFVSF
jgi:hypothetical protein